MQAEERVISRRLLDLLDLRAGSHRTQLSLRSTPRGQAVDQVPLGHLFRESRGSRVAPCICASTDHDPAADPPAAKRAAGNPEKRVVLFGPWPPPYGGVASHMQDLARNLAARGGSG